ncbi:MAG: DUF3352 domain-containing protein, partial [Candidatus Limnocylindria bacterium]
QRPATEPPGIEGRVNTVSVVVQPATSSASWRLGVMVAVAVLATGIGLAAGSTLLNSRATGAGSAAAYVPADAALYLELRLEPSAQQDAALREILGRFPPIDGIDADQPLYGQLTERLDELLADEAPGLSWSEDIAPWFDGHLAVAVTDIGFEAMSGEFDPMNPPAPEIVVFAGVTDAAAARTAVARIVAEAGREDLAFTDTEHNGVTIRSADGPGAYAVTDDNVLLAEEAGTIEKALDASAASAGALGDELTRYTAQLPTDWLAFGYYDFTELMTRALSEAGAVDPQMVGMVEAYTALFEHQPLRGAMAFSASGDRLLGDAAVEPPTGPFAVENRDRGLADEVPSDTLYYSEAGNLGTAMAAIIEPMTDALASVPEGDESVAMIESALGADLEELVEWIGDGAVSIGWDGSQPYGGLVLVPTDVDAAEQRLDQLATFAGLAAMDPANGVNVTEEEVGSQTVTTISWTDPSESTEMLLPFGQLSVEVQYTVTDDRAIIGFGDAFVGRVLGLDPGDALGSQERYTEAVAELGGSENGGVTWLDLAGTRIALEESVLAYVESMGGTIEYESEIKPWVVPFDRLVTVTRLEDDVLVQRSALMFE